MAKEGKELLDRFFKNMSDLSAQDQLDIWSILTALRGHDTDELFSSTATKEKSNTTAVIRGLVLHSHCIIPQYATVHRPENPQSTIADQIIKWRLPPYSTKGYRHFQSHIKSAYSALERQGYFE
jgi:hypothetical protein